MPLLQVRDLRSGYGRVPVLSGVSIAVGEGEWVAVVGANGAGKTTLLRTISATVNLHRGQVLFDGRDIGRLPPHRIPRLGVAHVPEGRQVFPRLTVRENLLIGAHARRERAGLQEQLTLVTSLFPRLAERFAQAGGSLSGGEQQMLAIGRALMLKPRLLMLDEPSQGLAPKVVGEMYAALRQTHALGLTILLVEQNAAAAFRFSQRAYVLEHGRVTLEGRSEDLAGKDEIRRAYLGV